MVYLIVINSVSGLHVYIYNVHTDEQYTYVYCSSMCTFLDRILFRNIRTTSIRTFPIGHFPLAVSGRVGSFPRRFL